MVPNAKTYAPTRTLSRWYLDLEHVVSRCGIGQAGPRHTNPSSPSRSRFKLHTGLSMARQAVRTLKLDRKSTHSRYDYFDITWIGVLSNVWMYICMLALESCILYTFVCIRDMSDRSLWIHAACVRACVYGKVRGSAAAGCSKEKRSRKSNCRNSVGMSVMHATRVTCRTRGPRGMACIPMVRGASPVRGVA